MRSAPWHLKGIAPEARETAREAARRSGMSVGQWLNAVILDHAEVNASTDDDDESDWHPDAQDAHDARDAQ